MSLFSDEPRSDSSPARHAESSVAFYDRVAGQYWDDVRQLMEHWFARFCANGQADVRARLRSTDDRQARGAFFELYLHELLVRSGCSVTCHPEIPNVSRVPDFLATRGDESFYLEARVIVGSAESAGRTKRINAVYDALNSVKSEDYFVWVDVESAGLAAPRTKQLRGGLEAWLGSLDYEEVRQRWRRNSVKDLPVYRWQHEGWNASFRPVPKGLTARGVDPNIRPLGVFGGSRARWADDTAPIREALADKGTAYGKLDKPFVVAVGTFSSSDEDDDIRDALYGTEAYEMGTIEGGETVTRPVRQPDGYWSDGVKWLHGGVSGVLLVRGLAPESAGRVIPTLWQHPEAVMPMKAELPACRRVVVAGDRLEYVENSVSPRALFALPDPWPSGEPFPRVGR